MAEKVSVLLLVRVSI